MINLALAMRASGTEGKPLPIVFPQLEEVKAHPRMGQVTMICAAPGGGKSAIMSEYVLNLRTPDGDLMKGMYFSADTDRMTLGKRIAAGILECTLEEAESWLEDNHYKIWDQLVDGTSHIWTCFDAGLTLEDIDQEVKAYAYATGSWPDWIVIDVLMNVQGTISSGDHVAYAESMEWLHMLARQTGSAVFVLHHVTGQYENGVDPIPLGGILGKVSKLARLILTLHQPMDGVMGVSVVKNSSGPADAEGLKVRAKIPWLPERSWFGKEVQEIKSMHARQQVDILSSMSDDDHDDFRIWG